MRGLVLFAICAVPALGADPITLELPVGCEIGKTCFIQQYFDHDRGPGAADYTCGIMSYDGHDGVDIRVPSLAAMRAGVAVRAAAPGTVTGARDGVADIDVRLAGSGSVAGRECGNGVVIAHEGGWETQYCHLKNGSLRVKPGDTVATGTVLGQIGESGDAAFPHLHFALRRYGEKLDPFATSSACGAGPSLWSAKAQAALAYRAPQLLNSGFSGAPVRMEDIESGVAPPASLQAGALVAFARAISLAAGDVQELTVLGPDGAILASQTAPPLDSSKAQWMLFTGKKRPAAGFAPGRYTARYAVRRGGKLVLQARFETELR